MKGERDGRREQRGKQIIQSKTNKKTPVYLVLELGVGIDSVHLPGLGKKSSKGESEPKSQEP